MIVVAVGDLLVGIVDAGEGRAGRPAGAKDMAVVPGVLDLVNIAVEVAKELVQAVGVLDLDYTHSAYLHHFAYRQEVTGIHLVPASAEEVVVASHLASPMQNPSFVYAHSHHSEGGLWMNSSFEIVPAGQIRICSKRRHLADYWRKDRTRWGERHCSGLAGSLP